MSMLLKRTQCPHVRLEDVLEIQESNVVRPTVPHRSFVEDVPSDTFRLKERAPTVAHIPISKCSYTQLNSKRSG